LTSGPTESHWAEGLSVNTLASLCDQKFSSNALALALTTGTKALSPETLFNGRYDLLRYLARDDSRSKWQAMTAKDPKIDRDACIQNLWELIQGDSLLEELHHSAEHHRWVLFHWFLERYNPARARSIWMQKTLPPAVAFFIRHIHYSLFFAMLALTFLLTPTTVGWLPVAFAVAAPWVCTVALQWEAFRKAGPRMAPFIAAYSLIPRLAGTALVGILFLLSNQQVSKFILGRTSHWTVAVMAVAFSTLYVVLEMSQRIHPSLRWPTLLQKAFVIVTTGASYALALALTGMPAIRLVAAEANPQPATLGQIVLVAAIILTIGLVVNVIWSEDPVTKPF
jgi:hypothetical protein